jgi:hypothetical protein
MKHVAVILGFLLLAAHTTVSLWSVFSTEKPQPRWMVNSVQPLFKQPWREIGSDYSTSSMELEYRAFQENDWTEWKDATGNFAYDPSSPVERLEQGINEELRWQLANNLYSENGRAQLQRVTESAAFAKALYYTMRMEKNHSGAIPDSVQLRVAIQFIPPTDQAHTIQKTHLNFPAYSAP